MLSRLPWSWMLRYSACEVASLALANPVRPTVAIPRASESERAVLELISMAISFVAVARSFDLAHHGDALGRPIKKYLVSGTSLPSIGRDKCPGAADRMGDRSLHGVVGGVCRPPTPTARHHRPRLSLWSDFPALLA